MSSTRGTGPDLEFRLRSADPAAGAELDPADLSALRAAVDARIASDATRDGRPEPDGTAVPGGADELAVVRARRRWTVRAASVAAAALVVGAGGGYAVGAMGDPADPALTLVQAGEPASGSLTGPTAGGLATAPEAAGSLMGAEAQAAGRIIGGVGGRTVFEQTGLPTQGTTGTVWGFDPAAVWSPDTLRAAGEALGVTGEVQQHGAFLRMGPEDGSGPTVELYADGTGSFGFWDPTKDPWRCDTVAAEPMPLPAPDEGDGTSVQTLPVEPGCAGQDLGAAPTGAAATDVVRDALVALGVDAATYEIVVEGEGADVLTHVLAHQVVDGRRTGASWSASLTGAGISGLNGQLAPLVDLGGYDVVSPAEAVERLMDPRFGHGGPMRWLDGREPAWSQQVETPSGPPGTPGAGTDVVWPVGRATIVEAELGSAMHWSPDGATLLVPTYELTDADGAVWTVLGVADRHLDTSGAATR